MTLPTPVGYVNDYVGVLTDAQRSELEETLKVFESTTSNEVVVAIVPSFQGLDPFTYSQELFDTWQIGKKKKDNGVLFVIGPKGDLPFPQRGDAFINVGKGLEGAMPDSLTGTILRNEVFPRFKEQHFFEGVRAGLGAIMKATRGEYKAETNGSTVRVDDFSGLLPWVIFICFAFLTHFVSFMARSKSWWLGGVVGGVGGFFLGLAFYSGVAILGVVFPCVILGSLFDFIVSKNYQERLKSGKPTDYWHSGGGFWWGGGGRGGFGGGGGFGGFGGGGSGGGGAGGGW